MAAISAANTRPAIPLGSSREDHALLRFRQALRRQRALDDVLIEAPVAEVRDPHAADQHRQARQIFVVGTGLGEDHVEVIRRALHQRAEARDDAGAAADFVERQSRHHQAAEHEQRDLHDVGHRDRAQPAPQLMEEREQAERNQRRGLINARYFRHGDRAEPHDGGQVHEDVEREPEHCHQRADARSVPLLEKLRHRVDLVLEEDRQEPLADDHQRDPSRRGSTRSNPYAARYGCARPIAPARTGRWRTRR